MSGKISAVLDQSLKITQNAGCDKIFKSMLEMIYFDTQDYSEKFKNLKSSQLITQFNNTLSVKINETRRLTGKQKKVLNDQLRIFNTTLINQTSVNGVVDINKFLYELKSILRTLFPNNGYYITDPPMTYTDAQKMSNFGQTGSNYFIIFLLLVIVYFVFFNKRKVSFGKRRR